MDLALAIAAGFLQLALLLLGVYVSLDPPTRRQRWKLMAVFLVIGVGSFAVTIWQYNRSNATSERLAKAIGRVEEQTKTPPSVNVNLPNPLVTVVQVPSAPTMRQPPAQPQLGPTAPKNVRIGLRPISLSVEKTTIRKGTETSPPSVVFSIANGGGPGMVRFAVFMENVKQGDVEPAQLEALQASEIEIQLQGSPIPEAGLLLAVEAEYGGEGGEARKRLRYGGRLDQKSETFRVLEAAITTVK